MQRAESLTQPTSAQKGILGHVTENSGARAGFRQGIVQGLSVPKTWLLAISPLCSEAGSVFR